MKNFLYFVVLVTLIFGTANLSSAPAKHSEEIVEFTYVVVARDLTRHKVRLRFSGETWSEQYQTGRAADLRRGRLQDTRECRWNIWNHYNSTHVETTSYSTGAQEQVSLGRNLFKSEGFPLHAPYAAGFATFLAELKAWVGIDKIRQINDNGFQILDPAKLLLTAPVRVLARMTGLRKGTNCGEMGDAIEDSISQYKKVVALNMKALSWYGYFLNGYRLQESWSYRNPNTGSFVGALIVYPDKRMPDFAAAVALQWKQIRDAFRLPVPTDDETAALNLLIEKEPDSWIEKLILLYADSFSDKVFDETPQRIDLPGNDVIDPWLALQNFRESNPFVVIHHDYPALFTSEFNLLDDRSKFLVLQCGDGRLYEIKFENAMTDAVAESAVFSLRQSFANAFTLFQQKTNHLVLLQEWLPANHELAKKINERLTNLTQTLSDFRELNLVFNPRNQQFQRELIEANKRYDIKK